MKALIIGAGAVGQVYGRHLQLGGAEVSFFVRPKYAEECRRGFVMYPLNRSKPRGAPVRFTAGVITEIAEIAKQSWDQVHLCVSSPALRGPWLDELLAAVKDATVVMLQPGLDDRAYLLERLPADRLVIGLISMISYHAPLPGERVPEPGMAYWFPPLGPSFYSGARAKSVVEALAAGRCPAKVHRDVATASAFPAAVLQLLVAALEESDWSFDKLTHGDRLQIACDAFVETRAMLEKKLGAKAPMASRWLKPCVVRMGLPVAKMVIPLDLETYLRSHFTKVGDQTRFIVKGYADATKALKLPSHQLEALVRKLPV